MGLTLHFIHDSTFFARIIRHFYRFAFQGSPECMDKYTTFSPPWQGGAQMRKPPDEPTVP